MARKTCLDIALFTINALALITKVKSYDHNFDLTTQEGRAINARWSRSEGVKRAKRFAVNLFQDVDATHRASHLNVTAYSIGGSRLADLDGFTITYNTTAPNGAGVGSLDESAVAVGTSAEIHIDEFVSATADLSVTTGMQGTTVAALEVAVAFTINGVSFTMNGLLTAGSHKIDGEQIQMQNVTIKLRGTLATPTGTGLLGLIATGTAAVTYSYDTGAGTGVGAALITKAVVRVADSALIEEQYEFTCQGLETAS